MPQIVKNKDTFSGQAFYWLGMIFIFLALFAYGWSRLTQKARPVDLDSIVLPENYRPLNDYGEGDKRDLLEQLNFRRVHENYQSSYLDLINKISQQGPTRVDLKKNKGLFLGYDKARSNLKDTIKKVEEYEKDFRLKCFARMRSIILAVLFYDRQNKTRMTRFKADELVKVGALQEIPVCPRGGRYSIIYKDGRRLFHCSIHGTLRN